MTGCKNQGPDGAVPNSTWGPAVWNALHALSYGSACTAERQDEWINMLTSVASLIPCNDCKKHFTEELQTQERNKWKILQSPEDLQKWLWEFHHRVTARVRLPDEENQAEREQLLKSLKKGLDLDTVRKRYMTATQSCGLGKQMVVTGGGSMCLPTTEAFEYSLVIGMLCVIVIVALLLHRCEVRCSARR